MNLPNPLRRWRTPALILVSALALGLGCSTESPDESGSGGTEQSGGESGGDEAGTNEGGGDETGAGTDEGTDPAGTDAAAADPSALATVMAHVPADAFVVGAAHPERLAAAWAADTASGASLEGFGDAQGRLADLLGPLAEGIQAETWTANGFDPSAPMGIAVTTAGDDGLAKVFAAQAKGLEAVDTVYGLVRSAGEAGSGSDDSSVRSKARAFRDQLNGYGFVLRLTLPATDTEAATTWLVDGLEQAGFAAGTAPEGTAALHTSESGASAAVRKVDGAVLIDVAWVPRSPGDAAAHTALTTGMLAGVSEGATELPLTLPDNAVVSLTVDPALLGKLHYINELHDILDKLADLQSTHKVGRRLDPGNALLSEIERFEAAAPMFDQMLRGGPHSSYEIVLETRADSSEPASIVATATLKDGGDISGAVGGTALTVGTPFTASANAALVSVAGAWVDAGLDGGSRVEADTLWAAAGDEHVPQWWSHPAFAGLWLYPMPSILAKAHMPQAMRDPSLGLERVQIAIDGAGPAVALVGTDDTAVWQHALACAAEGKSSTDSCNDGAVSTEGMSKLTFPDRGENQVSVRVADGKGIATIGFYEDTVGEVADAGTVPADNALHVRAELDSDLLAGWLTSVDIQARPAENGVAWHIDMATPVALPLLAYTAIGIVGSESGGGGLDRPTLGSDMAAGQLIRSGLGAIYEPRPKKRPASSGSKPKAKDVKPENLAGIKKVFDTKKVQVEKCYKRVMQKFGAKGGEIAVMVFINADGSVQSVRVRRDQIGNGFGGCVSDRIKSWKFPPQGDVVKVGKTWKM